MDGISSGIKEIKKWVKNRLTYTKMIAGGYLALILLGACILSLPIASRDGQSTDFLTSLFTATTSTCVTGLVVVDTGLHWSWFGQLVILLLIQIGGLGFITMGVGFAMILKKKITLSIRELVQESMNTNQVGGMVRLIRSIFRRTIQIEAIGAILLSIRFVPQFGWVKGIYFGIFHSISAFCNAGIDLMGPIYGEYSSFTGYASDPLVVLTLGALVILGGIGFLVWDDVVKNKWNWKRYSLHSKLAISISAVLIMGGTILFYLLEKDYTLANMEFGERMLAAFFDAMTPRTAGFNTTDTAALSPAGRLVTIILMFIGGSPGSTAGGVKTVTVMVLLVYVWTNIRDSQGCNIYGRRIGDEDIKKASNVVIISLCLGIVASLMLCCLEPGIVMDDILFEVFSAIGTVGMSTGITRSLHTASRMIVIVLMYCGRIGSMSFALFFAERKKVAPIQLPEEKIMIG